MSGASGLAGTKVRADTKESGKAVSDKDIRDAVRMRFGGGPLGAFSGERSMNQMSDRLALDVRELLDANPGLDLTRAIAKAAELSGAKVTGAGN